MSCSFVSKTYTTKSKTECNRPLKYCRSFGFQKRCCRSTQKPDDVSVPLPLGCNDLIVVLMFPFLADPLNNLEFIRKSVDLGRPLKTRLVKGVDFSGSVFPLASDVIEFNDVDLYFLNSFTIARLGGANPVLVTVERQADGSFFARTSDNSSFLAFELIVPPDTDQDSEVTVDSNIPTVCSTVTGYSAV